MQPRGRLRIARLAGLLASLTAAGAAPAAAASLCLTSANDGREIARRPLGPDGAFALSFIHSVSSTPVTDTYKIFDGAIIQTAEIFQGHGAGLPSTVNDVGVTGWRHEQGRFIIEMRRPMGPIRLRVQAQYRNTLHIAGAADLTLAELRAPVVTVAPCQKEDMP